jgi:hypothetical protein
VLSDTEVILIMRGLLDEVLAMNSSDAVKGQVMSR